MEGQSDITNGEFSKPKSKSKNTHINKDTFPLKITLFLCSGAVSAIAPYLTIHMQDLGISIEEVAIIYAVLPFTSFIGPLILGGLADRFGDYKWVLILATFGTGFCHTLLLFVPEYKANMPYIPTAQIRLTPALEQGFLVPISTSHCSSFISDFNFTSMDETITGIQCKLSDTRKPLDEYLLSIQHLTLHFSFVEKLNCSIILNVVNMNRLLTDYNDDEFICTSNHSYVSGEFRNIGNNSLTFWLYFFIRVISTGFLVGCLSLLDASTLAMVKKSGKKSDFGRERIWSIIGCAIVSPLAGVLVDHFSTSNNTNYAPAFFICDLLLLASILSFFFLKLEVDAPQKGMFKNGLKLIKYPEVLVFLLMIFLLGNMWGFVESYLFIFLKELHAPNFLLGLTLTVGSVVGIPFLWGSDSIVNKFGRVNLIIVAFVTYFVRFFGYSYLQDPFWCFPFEAMEAFTVHLMWTAAATYCSLLAPKGMLATLAGIMGSLHYSLGKGVGSFIGGISYGLIGARLTFRYFGLCAGFLGIIFYLIDYFWIRVIVLKRLEEEKSERDEDGGVEIVINRKLSVTRRSSIFNANPFSKTTNMISLEENEESK